MQFKSTVLCTEISVIYSNTCTDINTNFYSNEDTYTTADVYPGS